MNYIFILRIAQLLLALLVSVFSLCCAAISTFGDGWHAGSLNFLLFSGIWGFLSVLFLVLFVPKLTGLPGSLFIVPGVELLCLIFFFSGFIAAASAIGDALCSGYLTYPPHSAPFWTSTQGACRCAKAAIVFGAFSWVLWVVSFVLVLHHIYSERSSGVVNPDPPSMVDSENGKVAPVETNLEEQVEMTEPNF